jgi:hypothetical protein
MTNDKSDAGQACENTDRHLWPIVSRFEDPYESMHVTKDGAIGINICGNVIVKTMREWHASAGGTPGRALGDDLRSSKEEVIRWLHRINITGGLGMDTHAALDNALLYLRSAPEPPAECAGCEEFVRMQHDRIYGALSTRATQPPGLLRPGLERAIEIVEAIETPSEYYDPYKNRLVNALGEAIWPTETKAPECQHDQTKPNPTIVPLGSAAFGSSDWTWMCAVCNDRFDLPVPSAQGEPDGLR